MATIRDVARIAGVSISTVSLTLNAPDRVSAETRARVSAASAAVGYVANPIAQSLKRGRSRLIGMVVSDITNPFFGSLLREVERFAGTQGYMVVLSDTHGDEASERAILRHMDSQRVAGLILSPCGLYAQDTGHIARLGMPFVLFDHRLSGVASDYVGTDNRLAAAMLTEHLIRLGHRRIAMIAGTTGLFTATERTRGFAEAMAANGIGVDDRLVVDGRYDGKAGYEAAMRLLTMGPDRPTAILAASNVMALGALQACNDLSVGCPDQVSLAGIDDVPWSAVIRPRITMAVQPVDDLARAAARMLMERIALTDQATVPPRDVVLAPWLVIGESTRAPAG